HDERGAGLDAVGEDLDVGTVAGDLVVGHAFGRVRIGRHLAEPGEVFDRDVNVVGHHSGGERVGVADDVFGGVAVLPSEGTDRRVVLGRFGVGDQVHDRGEVE